MVYKAPSIGHQISCVMYGLDEDLINSDKKLEVLLEGILLQEKFTIKKRLSHNFDPQGCTIAFILEESHAILTTYPEHKSAHFDIYSCRNPGDATGVYIEFRKKLNPSSVNILQNTHVIINKELNSKS